MNSEVQTKIEILAELQEMLCAKARELQDLLLSDLGTNDPVIWANKLSTFELEEMRDQHRRAYAPWGSAEESLLIAMYRACLGLFVAAQVLGRTENSVLRKLMKLKNV